MIDNPDSARMPLADAHDALGDLVTRFHNDMVRVGIKELRPSEWLDQFRSYLTGVDLDRDYAATLKWLAEFAPETR